METRALQQQILANKIKHRWNTTDVNFELLELYQEVGEAFKAHLHHDRANLAEELADVVIFALGIAEIEDLDLGAAVTAKVDTNAHRVYDAAGHKHLE
ncbi:MazG nucleotide pyrophosphohydrolase domain-containing protein [Lacticaseibacillus daqingensis]|uniref:MazG nucleotide pyrophosphohydrolase domain-containing protein n=1 Tax=Lacticaseibacillus daqingensis TaxID=2486014 RepID=UPI000F7BA981|nr:MazG nucleotide pyrophosphohydrolase domain-containing protein [Lacticaseibacillus daqingensis]